MLDLRLFMPVEWLRRYHIHPTDPADLSELMADLSRENRRPEISQKLLYQMLLDRNLHMAVVRSAATQRIVATGNLYVRPKLSQGGALVGEIQEVVRRDLPEFRGKGLGEAISRALDERAQALGVMRLRLHTSRQNAAELYLSLGWKPYGTQVFEKYLPRGPALAVLESTG